MPCALLHSDSSAGPRGRFSELVHLPVEIAQDVNRTVIWIEDQEVILGVLTLRFPFLSWH